MWAWAKVTLGGLVMAAIVLPPLPTSAVGYCGRDHGIWLVQNQNSGHGSKAGVTKYNHIINVCSDPAQRGGAAQIVGVRLSFSGVDWVELGLRKDIICSFGCAPHWRLFTEYGFYPATGIHFHETYNADGQEAHLKATNVPGEFDWNFYWDRSGGGVNWLFLRRYNNMASTHGWAFGAAVREGANGTIARTHHWNFQRKQQGGDWVDITQLLCWDDTDVDVEWVDIADDEFRVNEGNRQCTPHE
jgi:hypothetical protein